MCIVCERDHFIHHIYTCTYRFRTLFWPFFQILFSLKWFKIYVHFFLLHVHFFITRAFLFHLISFYFILWTPTICMIWWYSALNMILYVVIAFWLLLICLYKKLFTHSPISSCPFYYTVVALSGKFGSVSLLSKPVGWWQSFQMTV